MAFSLILNSSNSVNTTTNTQFKYSFLSGNFKAEDMEMCISGCAIPYAFPNVSTYYNNQKFSLIFPTGATTTTLNVTLPTGFYTITDINNAFQNACITAGLYLIRTSTSQNVYFFNISLNLTLYTTQIVCSPVPTVSTGYTLPSSGTYSVSTGLPTIGYTPQFVLPSSGGINSQIGFPLTAGTYPAVQQTSTYSITGAAAQTAAGISPVIGPVGSTINSIIVRCSILKNSVTVPSDILDGFNINTTYGSNITYNPPFEKWIPINDGTYSNFLLSFVDQNLNTIYSNDPTIALTLLIRKRK